MATTIRQVIQDRIHDRRDEIVGLKIVLGELPSELLDVEADSVSFWAGNRWFRMRDKSHPELCAALMAMGLEPTCKGRKKVVTDGMKTEFTLRPGDEKCVFVDVVRPGEDCVKARVRITSEQTVTVCGELPPNYEIIEVLDGGEES